jgi:hypothetical protein
MAAFCACCGAEIGPKAEACPACGTPQHGMIPKGSREKTSAVASPKRDEEVSSSGSCRFV